MRQPKFIDKISPVSMFLCFYCSFFSNIWLVMKKADTSPSTFCKNEVLVYFVKSFHSFLLILCSSFSNRIYTKTVFVSIFITKSPINCRIHHLGLFVRIQIHNFSLVYLLSNLQNNLYVFVSIFIT